jgi:hypothetical protein
MREGSEPFPSLAATASSKHDDFLRTTAHLYASSSD